MMRRKKSCGLLICGDFFLLYSRIFDVIIYIINFCS